MRITNSRSLLVEELKDIYDFEKRLVQAIPKMAKAATSDQLRSGLMEHLEVTRNQVQRIEQVFEMLDVPAKAKTCDGMKGIITEGQKALGEDMEDTLRDTAIASAARRVEHYEMASYASAQAIAEHLGHREVADLLQQSWEEERETDEKLGELAEQMLQMDSGNADEEEAPESRKPARKKTAGSKSARKSARTSHAGRSLEQ